MRSHIPVSLMPVLIILFMMVSCKKNTVSEPEAGEDLELVSTAINDAIGWAKDKDFDLLYSVIANDSDYLEIDPGTHIIRGFEEFKKNEVIWRNPDFKSLGYEISDLRINFSEMRNVAWYYCELDDMNEWKGNQANWMDTRWTGVLEKRKGRWVIVQMHFSFASTRE